MKIAVIGGDKRMLFAARSFLLAGCEVSLGGFGGLRSLCEIQVSSAREAAQWADIIVLPVRPVKDGMLFAPFASSDITVESIAQGAGDKAVFSGDSWALTAAFQRTVYDYAAREDFLLRNAKLTAEGALGLLITEYEGSLFESRALVLGYGRIGKFLAADLRALGARVTVAARKSRDRTAAQLAGCNTLDYSDLEIEMKSFDVILNTVPVQVLDARCVDAMDRSVFVIDLASAPGGVDMARAAQRDITCLCAPGLPGKYAPSAAGEIIKDTIISMIKEENGGKDHFGLCDDRFLLHL